ncbi:nuclease-related domain-containing protein [Frigoribacterium sp. 2-23]|uniref:nuclease-related domain-containing protein n=1 Tax=Frigoribacterium sp. 2-23 TaxID=3415006 RepID=UPI003C6F7D6E
MPLLETVPWAVAALLLVAVLVMGLVLRHRLKQARAAAADQARLAHERQLALSSIHEDQMARARDDHDRELSELASARERALDEARQARDLLATGLKWEATSRDLIADAIRTVAADAVLLTNVVFVPTETTASGRFVVQVDHVLVCEAGVLVIENKGWRGIVFDGRTPSSVFPAFSGLFDETKLDPPFALQVKDDSPTVLTVRSHLGPTSPAAQVRRQARRLADRVYTEIGARFWVDTCVLYSHPQATVFAADRDVAEGGATTRIVAAPAQLASVVRELTGRPAKKFSRARVEEIVGLLGSYGADTLRFGAYVEEARVERG